ncbi:alanine--glyoxylate aminotransferase family protein [uncultured Gimesia sp.]|uniref:pyridoxal-phosphate-dependent aminotransferase family protein n=1 Tax=uncultured Gimesia sp. TaxID=1678688 RepID=UPI0026324EBD|nr:alanine--glyoxylate aminotransferase family protein [uncultured Gimesia sp.]
MEKLRLFTPGPVPIEKHILAIGNKQPPYNRTEKFSEFTHELLRGLKYVFQTVGSVALITGSGTAAMEASVLNFLDATDKVLIINGGSFGQRWCDLCDIHSISYDEYNVPLEADVDLTHLSDMLLNNRYTALLINAHETSTGHLYDIQAIGRIARRYGIFFIVDAISTICADQFSMDDWHVDVAILSSQKALALPPGLSFVAMNQRAMARLARGKPKSLYFNLKDYLTNQQRGQLPYTPAIGLMLQLHQRLLDIQQQTLPALVLQHQQRAESFRRGIEDLAFDVSPFRSSNAMTALSCEGQDASETVEALRNRYNIIVAPNGGDLKSKLFRISHMGAQDDDDLTSLIRALRGIAFPETRTTTERIEV